MNWINLRKGEYLRMLTHSFHELPYEACGLITLERDGRLLTHPCENDEPSHDSFTVCVYDHELILDRGLPIVGSYHSHPRGKATLSSSDKTTLPENQIHFVIGMRDLLEVRAWRIENGVIRRIEVTVSDDPWR